MDSEGNDLMGTAEPASAALRRRPGQAEDGLSRQIETLRRERAMSLQSLARASGVAASTLSKIERSELSPTVATLQKIVAGLGIEMSQLFAETERSEAVQGRRVVTRAGQGTPHTSKSCNNVLLCAEMKNKKMVPVLTKVTARDLEADYPALPRSDDEVFLMVLKGRMLLHTSAYQPLEMGPGDSVYYDASAGHAWTSVGPEDAEVVWVMTA
ncbi:helix-turn-helix domain-containing protein [Mangrovicoccus sp. HB161399]|uniref:helix-turn-helix domain-containing protein n=1 Tax=Mangrovicoccus sp. HB161399 TaxID=2720392 RepID=UPI001556F60D|nr:XRE family transcriptional regulator [Mangrovicoccus sp. HB161399]